MGTGSALVLVGENHARVHLLLAVPHDKKARCGLFLRSLDTPGRDWPISEISRMAITFGKSAAKRKCFIFLSLSPQRRLEAQSHEFTLVISEDLRSKVVSVRKGA
jgi:hypothetical protein